MMTPETPQPDSAKLRTLPLTCPICGETVGGGHLAAIWYEPRHWWVLRHNLADGSNYCGQADTDGSMVRALIDSH